MLFDFTTVVRALLVLHVVALVAVFLPPSVPGLITAPPVVIALTIVPGGLLALLLLDPSRLTVRVFLYAVGLSLLSLLAIGFTINLFLPYLGVSQPLAELPIAVSTTLVIGLLATLVLRVRPAGTLAVPRMSLFSPPPLALASLPLLSILAVSFLNRTGDNRPLLLLLAAFSVTPLLAAYSLRARWHPFAVWSLALAVIYHKSFWKEFGFSGSPGVVRAWEAQRWSPGVTEIHPYSTELLQNGVLFPAYARLAGISIVTELEVVNPILVSFIPLAIFVAARRYLGSRRGLLGAVLFMFAHPFYLQYPPAGRAATPVLFLSLFALVITDEDLSNVTASLLALSFVSGIVVTHYGTSYFVMFAIIGALVLVRLMPAVDQVVAMRRPYIPDGGVGALRRAVLRNRDTERIGILSLSLTLFYSTGAIAWYMYATGGEKFKTLPNHIVGSVESLVEGGAISGRTGARLVRDYGSLSIQFSKYVYIALGVLMCVGVLYGLYSRFADSNRAVIDDHYLMLGSMMLGLFGLTIVARNWGGGRPMMITFVFTIVFAVLGAAVVQQGFTEVQRRLGVVDDGRFVGRDVSGTVAFFAVLLLALFVLNSGLASAIVIGGDAPSEVPLDPQEESHRPLDIDTHVWINEYGSGNVYGDPIAHGQTDWYLPAIELRTPDHRAYDRGLNKPRGELLTLRDPGVEPGYVMLLSHNLEEQSIVRPYTIENYPLVRFQPELDRRNRVYTTGLSVIYYAPEPPSSGTADE